MKQIIVEDRRNMEIFNSPGAAGDISWRTFILARECGISIARVLNKKRNQATVRMKINTVRMFSEGTSEAERQRGRK